MADDSDATLLDRVTSGLHAMQGLEEAVAARPEQLQTKSNAAWLRQQFDADPAMRRDYLQAAAAHPHLFRHEDEAAIVGHVEPVVRHFAADGLTRRDYLRAVAADPILLRQKPAGVISNLEAVLAHYAADRPLRSEYLQAAVAQPVLFRTPPASVLAAIENLADHLEAMGTAQSAGSVTAAAPHPPAAITAGQVPDSSPVPSSLVQSPSLYVSYVDGPGLAR